MSKVTIVISDPALDAIPVDEAKVVVMDLLSAGDYLSGKSIESISINHSAKIIPLNNNSILSLAESNPRIVA